MTHFARISVREMSGQVAAGAHLLYFCRCSLALHQVQVRWLQVLTCFTVTKVLTGTKVQILTPEELLQPRSCLGYPSSS
jgi:hypothetical protein